MSPVSLPVFYEVQWFHRRWWWLLGAGSGALAALAGAALVQAPSWPAGLLVLGGLPVFGGLWRLRLEVRLDAAGIHYRYAPLLSRWRHWPWSEFQQVVPRTYQPLRYGGWGLRGLPGNLVYNVWGREGLQLVFKSTGRLLLGTQQPEALRAALTALLATHPALPIRLPAA